jgi:hypothetical protein
MGKLSDGQRSSQQPLRGRCPIAPSVYGRNLLLNGTSKDFRHKVKLVHTNDRPSSLAEMECLNGIVRNSMINSNPYAL